MSITVNKNTPKLDLWKAYFHFKNLSEQAKKDNSPKVRCDKCGNYFNMENLSEVRENGKWLMVCFDCCHSFE